MKRILTYLGFTVVMWAMMPSAIAQKSTEQFIPIGKSPGLSGKYTVMGTIDSVDTAENIVFMQDSVGKRYEVEVAEDTKIYLDKSQMKESNEIGTIADCTKGAYCEVLYESRSRKQAGVAEWLKMRVARGLQK